MSSGNRWALMHELRGAPEPRLPELLRKMSQVDLVVVEGFKSEPHRKIEVHRQANGKAPLFPDDPAIAGIATDATVETALPVAHLDDIPADRRDDAEVRDTCGRRAGGKRQRSLRNTMAQLSDDCFAFGGPMMSVDEAVAIIASACQRGAARSRPCRSRRPMDAFSPATFPHRCRCRPSPIPPSTAMRCGARDLPLRQDVAFAVSGRIQAGAAAQEPLQPGHAVRIFTGAPMPEGAGTVFMQEDVRVDEAGKVVLPAGLRPGANVRPAGEDIPLGAAALASGLRLRPQDVALAAAFGLTRDRGAPAHPGRGVLDRQRAGVAGQAAPVSAIVRLQPLHADGDAGAAWLRGQRSRHFAR